jgi:hypothetical protein
MIAEPKRKVSVLESVRRLSIDAGLAMVGIDTDDLQRPVAEVFPAEDNDNDDSSSDEEEACVDEEIVYHPVSIMEHTGRANFEGLATCLPAIVLISASKAFSDFLVSRGGVWGDRHGVLCGICMCFYEAIFMLLHDKAFIRMRLQVGIPVNIATNVLVSCFLFQWRPGLWTPVVTTTALWISNCATYFWHPKEKRKNFIKFCWRQFLLAVLMHGCFIAFIFGIVISTRLLAASTYEHSGRWTVIVTGVVIPAAAFMLRKASVTFAHKHIYDDNQTMMDRAHWTEKDRLRLYRHLTSIVSVLILFVPTVLLYFNTSLKYALSSACFQLVTEVGGKCYLVWALKRGFDDFVNTVENQKRGKFAAATKFATRVIQEPGVNKDVQRARSSLSSTLSDEEEEEDEDEQLRTKREIEIRDKQLRRALRMLAVRWNGEIVAEKASIICGGVVAVLYFDDFVEAEAMGLALIGLVYFAFEAVTDGIFSHVMDEYMEVPMLSAVPKAEHLTMDQFLSSAVLALSCANMAVCVAMAGHVKL